MNKKQRFIILIGCVLIAGMALFPPYRGVNVTGYIPGGTPGVVLTRFIGYRFIYAPPIPEIVYEKLHGKSPAYDKYFDKDEYTSQLDIERLTVQIVAVVLITCGLAVAFQRRRTD
jgi:hypothetical protein